MADQVSPRKGAALHEWPVAAVEPPAAPVDVPPCPVCDATQATPAFRSDELDAVVVTCRECGLGRFHPMPDAEAVRRFYPDEYYGDPGTKFQPLIEGPVRWVGQRHIAFLSGGLRPKARILDVGCGRGVILERLADRGFEVHGFEVSTAAARGADPRAQIRIGDDLADAAYPDAFFDEVLIWHVLEHVARPRETLEEVHRILRPGGRLIVAVPNFGSLQARLAGPAWFHLDFPRHLFHFSLASLRRLLARCDFEILSEHHFSLRQNPFGWIQSALNRGSGFPRNALYTLLHRRRSGEPRPFDRSTRLRLWLAFALLAPVSLGLTVLETLLRDGATVHVVARRLP